MKLGGSDTINLRSIKTVAPNQAAVDVQQVNFNGQLNIAGAPEGFDVLKINQAGAPAN